MDDMPGYMRYCLNTGKLVFLAILVSGGIVLQILVGIFLLPDFIIHTKKDDNFLINVSVYSCLFYVVRLVLCIIIGGRCLVVR